MTAIRLTINGREVSAQVEPRLHLADFVREHCNLTATHLRCEQGACGACTVLIDGQPARSCITYAVMCDGAAVDTLEAIDDPVMVALRRAFSQEHGLQCGYCTPGMLITARDIVLRLPDVDPARIRAELSGNLCRCTGYVGIVRAISRVLDERRRGEISGVKFVQGPLGPVGARRGGSPAIGAAAALKSAIAPTPQEPDAGTVFGLAGREPNVEIQHSFAIARPPEEVWTFFGEIARVVSCIPGASLTAPPAGDQIEGRMRVKLGPITANFAGRARIERDDARRRGVIKGAGRDRAGGSRAVGEAEYTVEATDQGASRVALTIRALLLGPLAQFGRSAIVEDVVVRITETFARNLERRLSGSFFDSDATARVPLEAGALIRQAVWVRIRSLFARLSGRSGRQRP
jgi:aerobic carbon-monoxide dehydrogenase small subunit